MGDKCVWVIKRKYKFGRKYYFRNRLIKNVHGSSLVCEKDFKKYKRNGWLNRNCETCGKEIEVQ